MGVCKAAPFTPIQPATHSHINLNSNSNNAYGHGHGHSTNGALPPLLSSTALPTPHSDANDTDSSNNSGSPNSTQLMTVGSEMMAVGVSLAAPQSTRALVQAVAQSYGLPATTAFDSNAHATASNSVTMGGIGNGSVVNVAHGGAGGLGGSSMCKVCYAAEIDCALVRCGHVATCMRCSEHLDRCPICRAHIDDVIKIYHA